MENLAPAGNWESLQRAVAAGADAVYLGYAAFSARAGAGNFDTDELRRAVRFAHLHHVRVHVTVNTLVKDNELSAVTEVLRLLNDLRVDAVLVQDLGVLRIARRCFPDLPIHASTQMAIHNATGARWCQRMGMRRVVLARECSLSEISLAAREDIEVEVFGHGAQCVSVSGECLFSSMIGERSGNRGRCAQPCRMTYLYRGKKGAWLSPRDVCLRDDLMSIAKTGACSVKLEGRLKRPEYVAVVTHSYRRALDHLREGTFQPADDAERRSLLQAFQRGGFMRGYAMGCEDAAVICPDRVNHGGVALGRVTEIRNGMARILVSQALHDGDQLRIETAKGDYETIYAGPETPEGHTALLRLRADAAIQAGDHCVRLTDSEQLAWANQLTALPIAVSATLRAMPGELLSLTVTDGETTVTVDGPSVSTAKTRAMTAEDARRCVEKMGDTPFELERFEAITTGAFVPVSALNALRRDALEQLEEARSESFGLREERQYPDDALTLPTEQLPDTVIFRRADQLRGVPVDARLVWYPEDWRMEALETDIQRMPQGVWLRLPTVCEEASLRAAERFVSAHRSILGGVMLGSVGQLGLSWTVPIGAGPDIPVMNRRAAQLLFEQGCVFVTASQELAGRELDTLLAGNPPILMPAWGRAQLMLLHHCPARTLLGCDSGHAQCTMCDIHARDALAGKSLSDVRGHVYPLMRLRLPEGCVVRLLNDRPTDLRKHAEERHWPTLCELTLEDNWNDLEARQSVTSGHWSRPVE